MAKINFVPRPDRRAVELEAKLNQPGDALPINDPAQSATRKRSSFNRPGFVVFGRIVDQIAYMRTYKVQCADGLGALRCSDTADTGLGVRGAKSLATYTLGQGVLVFYSPGALHHAILCAVPDWMSDARDSLADMLVQGSNVGLQRDAAHNFPFTLQQNGGLIDFSANRPADSLSGEWGAVSSLGLRIFIDDEQIQVAVDEETGLFVCYQDGYTRLGGRNLDIGSAGYLREDRDDESEYSSVEEWNPYVWERLGLYSSSATPHRVLTAQEVFDSGNRSRLEPLENDQLGISRETAHHGYLGQGGRLQVSAPVAVDDLHTYRSSANSTVGLSEEIRGLDGTIGLRTAKGFYVVKSPLIPAPKRKIRPESHTGDRADDNYASCGLFGDGPIHHIQGNPDNTDPEPHMAEPAAILDLVAYTFNWKGLHPFHYHEFDWALAEESEMAAASTVATSAPDFGSLADQTYLDQAPTFDIEVDERYGLVEYYANIACFGLLPNGGIAQLDGWGAESRTGGGGQNIFVPGDLVIGAGRHIVLHAGHGVFIKGYHGVDINSTQKAVRMQAGTDIMIMGGNLGCGGVLIESKSEGPDFSLGTRPDGEDRVGGVVLRAKNSTVAAFGQNVVVATNAWGDEPKGHITIDAGQEAHIITRAKEHHRHIASFAIDVFSDSFNEYWHDQTILGGDLVISGEMFAAGQIVTAEDMIANGTMAAAEMAIIGSTAVSEIATMLSDLESRDLSSTITASLTDLTFLTDNTDAANLEFYYRTAAQILTTDFTIIEPMWAQISRANGGPPAVWNEEAVVGDAHDDSAPWPGHEIWFSAMAYGQRTMNLFDPLNMRAVDRGASYENATLTDTSWVSLDGNWPIIQGA